MANEIEYIKPELEVRAFYNWLDVENWLDSSFMDAMYVTDAWVEGIFGKNPVGFQYIDFDHDYKIAEWDDEKKRVAKLHGYLIRSLATNDQGIWVHF